jgi:AcrR family transcriptional regulator
MPAEQRRDQLLDAALAIIARDGYSAVSIEAIAREVDVTRPVVYNAFDGLDALLRALLDRQQQRAMAQLLGTIVAPAKAEDLAAYLRRTVTDLVAMVRHDPQTWTLIFLVSADTPAVVRERIEHDRDLVRRRIQSIVELALTTRRATGIDSGIVAHMLIAVGEYFGRMIVTDPSTADPDLLAATITGLLLPPA